MPYVDMYGVTALYETSRRDFCQNFLTMNTSQSGRQIFLEVS